MPIIERKPQSKSRGSSRIAIINRSCGIGDVLALRCLLGSISLMYCNYEIDIIIPSHTHSFLKDHPLVSRVLDPRLYKAGQFEKTFDLSGLTDRHKDRGCLDLWSNKIGIEVPETLDPKFTITQSDIERASKSVRLVSPDFRPIILVCPFGSIKSKRMEIAEVNDLTEALEKIGWCPIILHKILQKGLKAQQFTNLPFTTLLGLFSLCDGVISVATSHLWFAGLLGKPVFGILGKEMPENYTSYFSTLRVSDQEDLSVPPNTIIAEMNRLGIRGRTPTTNLGWREETVGIRISGLLGDGIRVSTLLPGLRDKNVIIMCSYKDPQKHSLLRDLYGDLLDSGKVQEFISSPNVGSLRTTAEEIAIFKDLGCQSIYEGNVFSREFETYDQSEPDLGFQVSTPIPRRVCLMRRSHLHNHFPERNRNYEEWVQIEEFLYKFGFNPEIIGVDDPMPNKFDFPDYRNLLDPLQSLKRACSAELVISTATFIPVFTNYYRPTLVLSDPRDVKDLKTRWYRGSLATVFDVSGSYIEDMGKYIMREFPGVKTDF